MKFLFQTNEQIVENNGKSNLIFNNNEKNIKISCKVIKTNKVKINLKNGLKLMKEIRKL